METKEKKSIIVNPLDFFSRCKKEYCKKIIKARSKIKNTFAEVGYQIKNREIIWKER